MDYLTNIVLRYKASNNFLRTTNTVTIQGWCEVEKDEELEKICKSVLADDYYLSFEEVKEDEIEEVPVKLKNGYLIELLNLLQKCIVYQNIMKLIQLHY